MEPILARPLGSTTLQAYVGMNAAAGRLYDTLYMDLIVTIMMTKNCGYGSLRKWLAQNHMGPNAQAYPTTLDDLIEMMNSRTFEPDLFNPKSKRNRKKKQKEDKDEKTIGAIVQPIPNKLTAAELDLAKEEVLDGDNEESKSNNEESIGGDLDTLSKGDKSSKEDNIQSSLQHVFVLVDSGFNEDETKFDPKADKEQYCDECEERKHTLDFSKTDRVNQV